MSKIALITGANRGLGKAYALGLAKAGVDLIVTYRGDSAKIAPLLDEAKQLGVTAVALELDSSDVASFDAFAGAVREALSSTWQRDSFDYLVNNAGIGAPSSIAEQTVEALDELYSVNFRGVVMLTQKLLPLVADDGGKILNFSTGLARFTGDGVYAAYGSLKGAIEVFTRYLAKEVGPRGISANTVAPGATATEFAGGGLLSEQAATHLAAQNVQGRMGQPEDIAGAVVALLTAETNWITAQRIEVSGGQSI
jgi:NAD(P)-dependent dehydrogenase (short-subunit alcohol dehydrogenase family)